MAEYVYVSELLANSRNLIPRSLRDHSDPFKMPETHFINRFRLSKTAAKHLCDVLQPYLNVKYNAVPMEIQVLTALRILGSGSFQNVVSDCTFSQISQSSASRYLQKVVDAIGIVAEDYIEFPRTVEDILNTQRKFYEKTKFPNVVGAVDCTHIYIEKPNSPDFFMYMNRKGRYSLNMQVICDSSLKILDVVARWPGSSHDSFIWSQSDVERNFRNDCIPCDAILLGDSGYPLESYLMTPYLDPICPSEHLYNQKHRSSRNVIERCFGLLKSRFRILSGSGGVLKYHPSKVSKIFIACCVLHNLCKKFNVDDPAINCTEDSEPEFNIHFSTNVSNTPNPNTADSDLNIQSSNTNIPKAILIRTQIAMGFQAAT